MTELREPSECTRRIYSSHRLYPPLPPAAGGTGARGLPIAIETRQSIEPTFALTTDGRRIPAIVGDLDATANDGGDEVHEKGYSRLKRSGALEPGGEKAESSDVTDLHSLEQLTDPQQRCRRVLRGTVGGATERTRQKLGPALVGAGTLALVVPNFPKIV